ncbi:hypothetical protein NQZ79_g1933 [Umbelopsis isabellina]|nr:hypothetical protein NQZ79_g1933 [Umbelopsis isabellina]
MKTYALLKLMTLTGALACYSDVYYRTKAGVEHYIANYGCSRICVCVRNVNTHTIYSMESASTKVFSSSDCTGNYDVIKSSLSNGEWVNSISFGPKGSSKAPTSCPSDFPQ